MASVTKTESFWKKIGIASIAFAATIAAMVGYNEYERKQAASKPAATFSGKFLTISSQSKDELISFMKRETSIIAVSTISISLIANRRQVTFFQSEDSGLQDAYQAYISAREKLPPVFTKDEHLNSRITSIINGNFECRKTADTIVQQLYDAAKYAPVTCSISVPPGFDDSGDFVGYINFFVKEELSDSEKARLAKEAIILSSSIYNRDIADQSK